MDDGSSVFIRKASNHKNLENAVSSLLDLTSDKEETVRVTCEASLVRISSRSPNEVINFVIAYKKKSSKQVDSVLAVILRIIEHVIALHIRELESEVVVNVVKFVISELTRYSEPTPAIHKPCKEILCGIGREHCKLVMDELTAMLQPHALGHFMVLDTLGTLTRSNLDDAIVYIKSILSTIIPMLSLLKHDYQKQAYALAIQNFCDAVTEHQSNVDRASNASRLSNEPDLTVSEEDEEEECGEGEEAGGEERKTAALSKSIDITTETGIIYDVILQQWLSTRDSKLCAEFLIVLSYMYPLLPVQKVLDNTGKIIQTLLMLYKRTIDRSSITVYLNSVIYTTSRVDGRLLEAHVDSVVSAIFDLICVNPDFEKPIAVRSHNEVLRCYDLIARNFGDKVNEIILAKFKANDERDKVKALILLTHLTNTSAEETVKLKVNDYLMIIRQMMMAEKSFKVKLIILRAIVAFAQKGFLQHKVFIKFIVHHCCHVVKVQADQGTAEEASELVRQCNNALIILSRTLANGLERLLKIELLQVYMQYIYTDATTTFAKCLAVLFQKDNRMTSSMTEDESENQNQETPSVNEGGNVTLPSAESIFVRSLVLLANFDDKERIKAVLEFLLQFCPNLSGKHLRVLWTERINNLRDELKVNDDDKFYKDLNIFIMDTIRDVDDPKFSESLVNKMSDQFVLYQTSQHVYSIHPSNQHQLNTEVIVPNLRLERGMLTKLMGLCLCYVTDLPSIDTKIDLVITQAKIEKLEKTPTYQELEEKFYDAAKAFGFISKAHFDLVMKKFDAIIVEDSIKKSNSFFANLAFSKDTQKESERYRLRILIVFSMYYIVKTTSPTNVTKNDEDLNDKVIDYLGRMLTEMRECQIKNVILSTLLKITDIYIEEAKEFKYIKDLLALILNIPIENATSSNSSNVNYGNFGFYDYLPLYPTILKLATNLITLSPAESGNLDAVNLLDISSQHFFNAAQNLSIDDVTKQSYLAPCINSSIPELNTFIKILLERNPSPATLDDIASIFEKWMKNNNSQVRICAALIMEKTLDSYIKSVKIGCEAPSKFHQTGNMLGKIVPRCIDSNAKVRETSVNILKKILELACIYETLTIPDDDMDWIKDLKAIREKIANDDNEEIVTLANQIANIIALRLSSQQYVTFSKALLYNLNDTDWNASAGSALVLNYFIQAKGSEIFHAIPDLVKDSFHALKVCDNAGTKTNIYNALVSLTKFHPKLVCAEMLMQPLPFDENVCEYWRSATSDCSLTGIIIDNFLESVFEVPPYEHCQGSNSDCEKTQKVLAHYPFAVVCALREMVFSKDAKSKGEFRSRFSPLLSTLLTTLACYINTIPSMSPPVQVDVEKIKVPSSASKNSKGTRFTFIPSRDTAKVNAAQIVIDTFIKLMDVLENENVKTVLQSFPQLATTNNLNSFMEFLTPLAVAVANTFNINSSEMKEIIQDMSKYTSSTVDAHRVAIIGFYSQLVPLRPCGEVSNVIMLHLTAGLSDPVASVRAFCIRGLAFVSELNKQDIEKYSELSLSALLKGIDDFSANCFINIPLESLRGLSRVIESILKEKLDLFEVSLTIRIKPFFDNQSAEIREAAILLFGNLCYQTKLKKNGMEISESLREQLVANLFPFLLHMGENESIIVRACKMALRNIGNILGANQLNTKIQTDLQEYQQLNYDSFTHEFIRIACLELPDKVPNFIESCLIHLKSQWREIQVQAIQHIGLLHHFGSLSEGHDEKYRTELELLSSEKIIGCLKDEQNAIKIKAAESIGYIFSAES